MSYLTVDPPRRHRLSVADYYHMAEAGSAAIVRAQDPVDLGAFSEPQPDITLLRPRADYYRTAHPDHNDVLLVIEVADSSPRFDRETKVGLYARHGIQEVWLVDVREKQLTRYRKPAGEEYTKVDQADLRAPVDIAMLPDIVVDLKGLFAD